MVINLHWIGIGLLCDDLFGISKILRDKLLLALPIGGTCIVILPFASFNFNSRMNNTVHHHTLFILNFRVVGLWRIPVNRSRSLCLCAISITLQHFFLVLNSEKLVFLMIGRDLITINSCIDWSSSLKP